MPLARLENFLKNLNGNTLYVDPNELDATDSIDNRGNSRLRPFKTIQRALLEAARFSYIAGSNNDLFDQTTILISPGTHYIDNRPGFYIDASNNLYDINNAPQSINEFNILSNFDIVDPTNELYIYNSVDGGVILPKGTSLVATDLRKTKIRPLFVPDPAQSEIERTAIFKLTGSCYFFGFTIFDGDPLGKVYNTYSTNKVTPFYSHHKLTAFEYADGVNKVVKNGSNLGHTDLEMYYYKLSLAYGQQSGRDVIDGYLNFQPNIDEFRIVGDLGAGAVNITSVISGDGVVGTNVITVTTETEHGLSPLTPVLISGVGIDQGPPTTTEYNGNFIVAQVLNSKQFTYLTAGVPTQVLSLTGVDLNGAIVKVISDTTTSSSPYIFNCSLKSVYGLNGLHADGSKATGFRSMVTAQFTGISLQKDDRAFVKYDGISGSYLDQTSFGVNEFLHQDANSIYQPDWSSFHIKSSNDSFIQCVSIFAIGYANQFVASEGGDQSITNSNSNFGERALFSEGFKKKAFAKDDHGFITHIIPPKDVNLEVQNINTYKVNSNLLNSSTRIYLQGYNDILNPPSSKVRGYSIGGKNGDRIYYNYTGVEYYADIIPNYQVRTNITAIDTANNYLTLSSISGIETGLAVKIIAQNSLLPDGIEHDQTYFARVITGNNIRIYENLANCNADTGAISIQNTIGLSSNNLYLVSKISDLASGDVGSPIQWDSTVNNWYLGITVNPESPTFVSNITTLNISPTLYIKRIIDTRTDQDRSYRVRYVVPKESENAAVPAQGFIFQKSNAELNSSYYQSTSTDLASQTGDLLSTIRNSNAIIDAWYTGGTATVVTKNPHKLRVGNKISIYNLKSSNEPNPVGLGTGTGFNGVFVVASVVDDLTFTYSISVNPGTISTGTSNIANWLSTKDCGQTSNFRIPPYTVYSANRSNLPFFTCNQIENHYQTYNIKQIQEYVQGSTDGIYHITLDSYKNEPLVSPFNTDEYKLGQSLDNVYPKIDFDNLTVDPDPSTTVSSRNTIGAVDINDPYLSSTKEIAVQYLKDFNLGKRILGFLKSGSNVTVTTEQNHGIGGIKEVNGVTINSGYVPSSVFYDLPLCGGSGQNATVNVTTDSSGTPISFEIANPGSGYAVGDSLVIKNIPGAVSYTTVIVPTGGLNFDPNNSDLIQILGATNSGNNGAFVISSVTANTITFANPSGVTEASTNAVVVLSGTGYTINSAVYDVTSGITTITTSTSTPHSLAVGNKVIFNDTNNLGICTVTGVSGITVFTVKGDASSANRAYSVGLIPTIKNTDALNENLNTRQFTVYGGYKNFTTAPITVSSTSIVLNDYQGLKKGDFVQIENEIMLVTKINSGTVYVKRALFGTQAVSHPTGAAVKTISILPVELRRPSILRASGHTFEYTGFGPGNYSTAMPSNQTKVLTDKEIIISQALQNRAGLIVYTGMNSNGEFFIGKKRWDAATGNEVQVGAEPTTVSDFDTLTVNKLIVNQEIDASTAIETVKDLVVTNISTFTNTTDSITYNDGAVQIKGGLGVVKSVNIGGNLKVSGILTSTSFSGSLANTLTLNTSGVGLSGSASFNNSSSPTFTVTSNATSSNVGGTLVARDSNGAFNAGAITGTSLNVGSGSINGGTITGTSFVGVFAPGTTLLFYQASAPTGWTQVTTHNNKALRVVSGTGGGNGGNTAFTSVFSARTPSGSINVYGTNSNGSVSSHTLSLNEIPSHDHGFSDPGHHHQQKNRSERNWGGTSGDASPNSRGNPIADPNNPDLYITFDATTGITFSAQGGGQGHNHGFVDSTWTMSNNSSFTGTSMDFAVQYIDVILASKN